ncbi:ABC transporter ATP-binding protein [Vagococcus humatus]|uniref:ATP-binding protein n=1 Tax=Vagococcus humatus TaxID=1889241 RepID=A0A429Z4E3_9ENTE|nr:ABC transporter ATP-binding protein [Vagococcus humatus]RST88554.1 ATP-binding protein [Vagococcus humatus]
MFKLLPYAKNYKKQIILGPIFKFLEAVFELLLPLYMARLIDLGIKKQQLSVVFHTGKIMLLMASLGLICVIICQYYSSIASQGFGTELRQKLLQKINTFSHEEIDQFGTSTLITRMTNDINQVQLALAMLIRLVIRAPFLSIGSIIMAFYIQPKMGLIFLVTLPIFASILFIIMKKTVPLYRSVQQKVDNMNTLISENLSGIRVIRAFSQTNRDINRMNQESNQLAKAYTRVTNLSTLLNPATTLILNASIIVLLYVGGQEVQIEALSQGQVLALINYFIQMVLALIVVANLVVIFTKASASSTRIQEVLAVKPSIVDEHKQTHLTIKKEQPLVLLDKVSFAYPKANGMALTEVSGYLNSGETLGIIGPTGSGKSTLVQLLPRFYDISSGSLLIGGHPVKEWPLSQLRQLIGMVPQKSVLFHGTIRENLQWGKKDASDQECWQALDIAQAKEFVTSLPKQLDTLLVEGGKNFSGGQKQRLAIARSIIQQPALLILDDSLSALDYQTDLALRKSLQSSLNQTGLIIISQKISSVKDAANILVLNDGHMEGFGPHSYLLDHSNVYQDIYDSQQTDTQEVDK